MAKRKRRRALGSAKMGGYPKHVSSTRAILTDWHGKKIADGKIVSCTRLRPGQRGSQWSNQRCSYRFEIDGRWYHGRGYGEGMSLNLTPMKRVPRR